MVESGKTPPQAIEIEEAVLGALLLEKDSYDKVSNILKPESFYKGANSIVYKAIQDLHLKNSPIDILTVTQKLNEDGQFENMGGPIYISSLTDKVASAAHIEHHAKIIEQKHIQREMIRASAEIYEMAFDNNGDADDILNQADTKFSAIREGIDTGEATKGFFDCLNEAYDIYSTKEQNRLKGNVAGITTGFERFDRIIGGWQKSDLVILGARPAMGKAQPLDSKVLTPNGYVLMGLLSVGDKVIGSDGNPCNITGVFPQGKKEVYEVHFCDGSIVECCDEHLWSVSTRKKRKNGDLTLETLELKYMVDDVILKGNRKNYAIPYVKPINFKETSQPIDPYIMGLLLGDGCFRKSGVYISASEQDILDYIKSKHSIYTSNNQDYRISGLYKEIKKLNLDGLYSFEKHIPKEYLFNSVENRIELLRGLIDTDGHVLGNYIEYSTSSEQLSEDVVFLVHSLGGRCTITSRIPTYTCDGEKKEGKRNYRVWISFSNGIIPVKSKKNIAKYNPKKHFNHRFITKIVKTNKYKEMQCIQVDAKDHLYCTENCIITHNTALALYFARTAAKAGHHTAFFSLEMSRDQLTNRMISSYDINPSSIRDGSMSRDELERYQSFISDHKNIPLSVDDKAGATVGYISAVCRKLHKKNPLGLIIIDYLQLISNPKSNRSRENEISEISRQLKILAKDLNVCVIALSQLSRSIEQRTGADLIPKLSDLRESGAIEQDADIIIFPFRPSVYGIEEDQDGNVIKKTDGKIYIRKHRNGSLGEVAFGANDYLSDFWDQGNPPMHMPEHPDKRIESKSSTMEESGFSDYNSGFENSSFEDSPF